MSFRTKERRNGSTYGYPLFPRVSQYQGVPLDVVRIETDKQVYLDMLKDRLKDLEVKQQNDKTILEKINSSIASLDKELDGPKIAELDRTRSMFEVSIKENDKQMNLIKEEIKKVEIVGKEEQESVF